jgi:serine protease inhibitor
VSANPMFRADRPFLLAIRERLSGTILFIGTIGAPDSR